MSGRRPATAEEQRLWTEQVDGLLSPGHPLVGRTFKVIGCLKGPGEMEWVLTQLDDGSFGPVILIDAQTGGTSETLFPDTYFWDNWAAWHRSVDPDNERGPELKREAKRIRRGLKKERTRSVDPQGLRCHRASGFFPTYAYQHLGIAGR